MIKRTKEEYQSPRIVRIDIAAESIICTSGNPDPNASIEQLYNDEDYQW